MGTDAKSSPDKVVSWSSDMGVSKKEISPCPIDATLSVIDGRWKMEGHHPLAVVGWSDENKRAAEEHS